MPPKEFHCKQCGNCCLNLSDAFQTSVSDDDDVAAWEMEGRYDILEWVNSIPLGNGHYIHDIWIHPEHGDVWRCPWLRKLPKQDKFICRIQDVKPEHCRNYPKSRGHAEETGCRGFE